MILKQLRFKSTTHRKDNAQGQALSFAELIHQEMLFYLTPMSTQCQEKKTASDYVTVKTKLLLLKNCDWTIYCYLPDNSKTIQTTSLSGSHYYVFEKSWLLLILLSIPQSFIFVFYMHLLQCFALNTFMLTSNFWTALLI